MVMNLRAIRIRPAGYAADGYRVQVVFPLPSAAEWSFETK